MLHAANIEIFHYIYRIFNDLFHKYSSRKFTISKNNLLFEIILSMLLSILNFKISYISFNYSVL